jgi:glutaredoxin 3
MKTVAIYTTNTCKYCAAAKDFFKQNNIAFSEYNVGTDLEKRKEMVEKSGQMGVPVITVDDKVVIGYDEDALKELLLTK